MQSFIKIDPKLRP